MKILYLFESFLPRDFNSQTLSPGELRVIASQNMVKRVIGLGPEGKSFYDLKTKNPSKTKIEEKITLLRFKSAYPYYLRFIPLFLNAYKLLKNEKFAIIHAESPHISGIAAVLLKKIFKTKIAVEYHASYDSIFQYRLKFIPVKLKSFVFWKLCDWVFHNADLILANSRTYADMLMLRYPQAKIFHYNPAVIPPQNLPQKRENKNIGFLGRLYPDKGAIYLLKAINLIKDELKKLDWKLKIAGEGPEENILKEYIVQHKLNGLVNLVGTQDRWEFLAQVSILVNPTIVKAALEMVIAEAAALSIPTVCFGDASYPETAIDQETGFKAENKDSKDLAKKILILVKSQKLRDQMGKNAYRYYFENYTFGIQVKNLSLAYHSIGLQ